MIDILVSQKDGLESCDYSGKTLSKDDITGELNKSSWTEDECDSDEDEDELNLSFREGMKRRASDKFCHDLKRIKFDNTVRDLSNNFSYKLDLVIKLETSESKTGIRNNHINKLQDSSHLSVKKARDK